MDTAVEVPEVLSVDDPLHLLELVHHSLHLIRGQILPELDAELVELLQFAPGLVLAWKRKR